MRVSNAERQTEVEWKPLMSLLAIVDSTVRRRSGYAEYIDVM